MLNRRLQVSIDDEQYERIVAAARERGVSVGAVVRQAIDRGLATPAGRRSAAAAHILAAAPSESPDVADLVAELDELRGRRG